MILYVPRGVVYTVYRSYPNPPRSRPPAPDYTQSVVVDERVSTLTVPHVIMYDIITRCVCLLVLMKSFGFRSIKRSLKRTLSLIRAYRRSPVTKYAISVGVFNFDIPPSAHNALHESHDRSHSLYCAFKTVQYHNY